MVVEKINKHLLLAVSGVLTGLTLVLPKIGFIEWLTLVPVGLFLLCQADEPPARRRTTYGYGFFFFMCYYMMVFHWFVFLYPLDFIDGMTPLSALAVVMAGCVGLSALQALFGGLLFLGVRWVLGTRVMTEHKALRPFAVAGLWAVYEWTQTLGWWGVPWGRLALGQTEYTVGLQTASLFGSYMITFAIVAVNMCVAYMLLYRKGFRTMTISVAAVMVFQYGVGSALYLWNRDGEETVRIAAVQGNIDSKEKWSLGSVSKTLAIYEKYTLQAASQGADIVVWPESALPYVVEEDDAVGEYCSDLARYAGVTIIVGAFTVGESGSDRNSLICVLPDGSFHKTVYSKQRLVPFGEFVPMRGLVTLIIPPLADLVMLGEDLEAGKGAQVIALEEAALGGLVCFDSIYEELTRDSVLSGAQVLCVSTNDSWFSDSSALHMHNAQARLRAIESGRYVIRAANTGISSVISSKGEVIGSLGALEEGMIVGEVRVNSHLTLYSRIGNLFVYLLIIFFVWLVVTDYYRKGKHFKIIGAVRSTLSR